LGVDVQRNILRARHVYVVGCGVAGLSAAVALAQNGTKVTMFESAPVAGGRCRSYMDPVLGRVIDNGNHLLLSGNSAALRFLAVTGGLAGVTICNSAEYAFVDLNSLERWKIRLNTGIVPWWIFDESRRVPGTHALEYLRLGRCFLPEAGRP
jgi:hydroxysqualene dehydroxylase